jgi:hypothetical protein
MEMFIASGVVMLIAITGMAVGVIFAQKPIQGSCGGIKTLKGLLGSGPCELCERKEQCKNRQDSARDFG